MVADPAVSSSSASPRFLGSTAGALLLLQSSVTFSAPLAAAAGEEAVGRAPTGGSIEARLGDELSAGGGNEGGAAADCVAELPAVRSTAIVSRLCPQFAQNFACSKYDDPHSAQKAAKRVEVPLPAEAAVVVEGTLAVAVEELLRRSGVASLRFVVLAWLTFDATTTGAGAALVTMCLTLPPVVEGVEETAPEEEDDAAAAHLAVPLKEPLTCR